MKRFDAGTKKMSGYNIEGHGSRRGAEVAITSIKGEMYNEWHTVAERCLLQYSRTRYEKNR